MKDYRNIGLRSMNANGKGCGATRDYMVRLKQMKKEITVNTFSFEDIRSNGYLYVDKTRFVYNLVRSPLKNYYFISRPRRFGKSLMCSTLRALFEGRRELFRGLYIESTDYSFEKYPVLHFDFSNINIETFDDFLRGFQKRLMDGAAANGVAVERAEPSEMLYGILGKLEKKAVILVDEYDYPFLHTYRDRELSNSICNTLNSFYSVIKSCSGKIRFFYVTGITGFSSLSTLSEMNGMTDLSMDEDYAAMFGYTEKELESYFGDYIDEYMSREDREYTEREEFIEAVRNYYDGYRFSFDSSVTVCNPVAVGRFFDDRFKFGSYWMDTGNNRLAVEKMKECHLQNIITEDLVLGIDEIMTFDYSCLREKTLSSQQVMALIYFTGYLTILEGDADAITLTFPNTEVRKAFTRSLVKLFTGIEMSIFAQKAVKAVRSGKLENIATVLNAYVKEYQYDGLDTGEKGYQEAFFSFFLMIGGVRASVEDRTLLGRSDAIVRAGKDVFIVEMKVDESADKALAQIKEKEYWARYVNTEKRVHLIGLNFSSETRSVDEWKEKILDKSKIATYLLDE